MLARLGFHGTEDVRGSTTFVFRYRAWRLGPDAPAGALADPRGERQVFRPSKPPARRHDRASHKRPERLPSCGDTRRPGRRCTTFFFRHGFRSWLVNKTRMVSRPTRGTSFRFTASSAISRTVHRACPSGG